MPVHSPPQKPMTRKLTEPVAPTPPRAITPSAWPTIAVSTSEYTCCSKSPNSTGTANCQISRSGLPVVKSCVMVRISFARIFVTSISYSMFLGIVN